MPTLQKAPKLLRTMFKIPETSRMITRMIPPALCLWRCSRLYFPEKLRKQVEATPKHFHDMIFCRPTKSPLDDSLIFASARCASTLPVDAAWSRIYCGCRRMLLRRIPIFTESPLGKHPRRPWRVWNKALRPPSNEILHSNFSTFLVTTDAEADEVYKAQPILRFGGGPRTPSSAHAIL